MMENCVLESMDKVFFDSPCDHPPDKPSPACHSITRILYGLRMIPFPVLSIRYLHIIMRNRFSDKKIISLWCC